MSKRINSNGRRAFLLGLGGLGAATLIHQLDNSPVSAQGIEQELHNKRSKNQGGKSLRQMAAAKG
ncbi:MAG: hypothetical protein AAFO76_12735, partial [Cyanobacteria bacterium J06607_15]